MDLKRLIIQEFNISKNLEIKIYFENKRRLISNDFSLKQMIRSMRGSQQELQVEVAEKRIPCFLCMKERCEHKSENDAQDFQKKRKTVQKTLNINILEPEKSFISIENESISTKKRKIDCKAEFNLSISQELSVPQLNTYIF